MITRLRRALADQSGFTILETLIATLLMTVIFATLATVTAQLMPSWNRGMARVQQLERLGIGIDRIVGDLSAAEFVPSGGAATQPLFEGSPLSVTFVRTAMGLNAEPGLELVRFSERADKTGLVLVRETRPFRPGLTDSAVQFGNPVVLMRAPYRVSFAYMGRDRDWRSEWHDQAELPHRVRVSVRDAVSEKMLPVSTIAALRVDAAAACAGAVRLDNCFEVTRAGEPPAAPITRADGPLAERAGN